MVMTTDSPLKFGFKIGDWVKERDALKRQRNKRPLNKHSGK
jgi:hypothetical protein